MLQPCALRGSQIDATEADDTSDFVMELRDKAVTPHVAQNQSGRRSAIDGRTTRHPGYAVSQPIRKRVEEAFGWAKTVAGLRKMRRRGLPKVDWQFTLAWPPTISSAYPNCSPRRRRDIALRVIACPTVLPPALPAQAPRLEPSPTNRNPKSEIVWS
jgi:hypothetical protein